MTPEQVLEKWEESCGALPSWELIHSMAAALREAIQQRDQANALVHSFLESRDGLKAAVELCEQQRNTAKDILSAIHEALDKGATRDELYRILDEIGK